MLRPRVIDRAPIDSALEAVEHLIKWNAEQDYQLLNDRDYGYLCGLRWGLWMAQGRPLSSATFAGIATRMEDAARRKIAS